MATSHRRPLRRSPVNVTRYPSAETSSSLQSRLCIPVYLCVPRSDYVARPSPQDRLIPDHSMDSRGLARSRGVVVYYKPNSRVNCGSEVGRGPGLRSFGMIPRGTKRMTLLVVYVIMFTNNFPLATSLAQKPRKKEGSADRSSSTVRK